ncbi:MAG: hypothetical protein AB2L20_14855 [Mangrovibacterium sp.]
MVIQYPHTIIITWTTEPYQDPDTGVFVPGAQQGPWAYSCRAVVNSKAQKIVGKDGSMMDYSFDVYMPKMEDYIPIDADYTITGANIGKYQDLGYLLDSTGKLILTNSDYMIIVNAGEKFASVSGKVKRAANFQLNSRLWL